MKRNCSLSPRQVGWFYLSIVCFSFAIAVFFAWQGSWLVLPFAGLEMAALGVALVANARHATDYERVSLADGVLVIEAVIAGRVTRHELNPRWVRVELDGSYEAPVSVRSGGRVVQVGRFLMPHGRRQFAQELSWWLRRA